MSIKSYNIHNIAQHFNLHQSTFMYFQSLWSYQRNVLITREERGAHESWPRRLLQSVYPDYINHKSLFISSSTIKGCLVYCMLTAIYIWLYVPTTTQHKFLRSLGTASLQKPLLTLRSTGSSLWVCVSLSYFLFYSIKIKLFSFIQRKLKKIGKVICCKFISGEFSKNNSDLIRENLAHIIFHSSSE